MTIRSLSGIVLFIFAVLPCLAQNSTDYSIETFGSATNGNYTPFWIVSNKYGTVPLQAGNAFLRTGVFHQQSYQNGLHWNAGLDVLAATPRYRNVYVQQIYAALQYKILNLTVGSHENYTSLWDRELSSGDMVFSPNARPIPEINVSVPKFTPVPYTNKYLQFRGNMAYGRSFDRQYLQFFTKDKSTYVKDVLWHHKSFQLRWVDPSANCPVTVVTGIHHGAQWGGTSTDPEYGKQPQSFKDLIRIFLSKEGGEDAHIGDRYNALGNHYGSYELQFGYLNENYTVHIYNQHFFDDKSGVEMNNFPDGLYGVQVDLMNFAPLNKIVLEFLDTRYQSGPVHFLWFDHDLYPGYGGGNDNYYNNFEYTTGVSYFNRSIGTPLLTSPEYNENHKVGFQDNRVRAFHLGCQGYLSNQVSYRLLSTFSEGWGTHFDPFLKKKTNFTTALKLTYRHPRLNNWLFTCEAAFDSGSKYGNNTGLSLSIKKTGIIKRWD